MPSTPIPVTVKVTSCNDDGEDEISMVCPSGTLMFTSSGAALRYNETAFDEENGNEVTQTVILFVENGEVRMNRLGPVSTTMVFSRKKPFFCQYNMPFGTLQMKIVTSRVAADTGINSGRIYMEYDIEVAGNPPMHHMIEVTYDRE